MSFIVAAVVGGFGILGANVARLLLQRRALRESIDQHRLRVEIVPLSHPRRHRGKNGRIK